MRRYVPLFALTIVILKLTALQYRDQPYRVIKADGDLVVLPPKYLPEIRHLPPAKLSGVDAQFEVCCRLPDVMRQELLTPDAHRTFLANTPMFSLIAIYQ